MSGKSETCFLRSPLDHSVSGMRMKRTLTAARGMTAYHGRMAWRVRREEEVPEMIGSKGLNFLGEVA